MCDKFDSIVNYFCEFVDTHPKYDIHEKGYTPKTNLTIKTNLFIILMKTDVSKYFIYRIKIFLDRFLSENLEIYPLYARNSDSFNMPLYTRMQKKSNYTT